MTVQPPRPGTAPAVLGNRTARRLVRTQCPRCGAHGGLSAWVAEQQPAQQRPVLHCTECRYTADGQWRHGGIDFSDLIAGDRRREAD